VFQNKHTVHTHLGDGAKQQQSSKIQRSERAIVENLINPDAGIGQLSPASGKNPDARTCVWVGCLAARLPAACAEPAGRAPLRARPTPLRERRPRCSVGEEPARARRPTGTARAPPCAVVREPLAAVVVAVAEGPRGEGLQRGPGTPVLALTGRRRSAHGRGLWCRRSCRGGPATTTRAGW
jgi:hypothetical protein